MSEGKVLFLEDDRFWALSYIEELQQNGFEVIYTRSATDALTLLEDHHDFDALFVDVMMATPEGVAESTTEDGESTGLYVIKQVQEKIVAEKISVWIVTNRNIGRVRVQVELLSEEVKKLTICDQKRDLSSRSVPPYLKAMIARNRLS